jgi:hypothetical protein
MSRLQYELEGEWEGEWEEEAEWEAEAEAEEFFGRLAGLARRAASSPALRNIGLSAARSALSGLQGLGTQIGGAIGGAQGGALGGDLGATLGRHLGGWLPQQEYEYEYETAGAREANPLRRVHSNALMEHLGHEAAEVESEAEAEAFLGALIPLAARLIPQVAPAVMRAAPGLIRGIANVGRTLRANPQTRPLVRALPAVVRQTTANLARQAQQGRPVTPQTAVRALAQQTARVIGNPRNAVQAFQRSRALDHRFHGASGAGPAGPARSIPRQAARPGGHICRSCQAASVGGVH